MINRNIFASVLMENIKLKAENKRLSEQLENIKIAMEQHIISCEVIARHESARMQGRMNPTLLRARAEQAAIISIRKEL